MSCKELCIALSCCCHYTAQGRTVQVSRRAGPAAAPEPENGSVTDKELCDEREYIPEYPGNPKLPLR